MNITAEMVRKLREETGAGMMECKSALVEANGDTETARVLLRKKGLASAAKKAGRATSEGIVGTYIHPGAKIGVLVEVNCETDFVAKNPLFQDLVKDLSMQVAATSPAYVSREEIPGDVLEKEREIYRSQMADQKKPAQVIDKIVEGKLEKYFSEQCLLEQAFVKDGTGKTKVKDLVDQVNAATKEKILVRRFARFQIGGSG